MSNIFNDLGAALVAAMKRGIVEFDQATGVLGGTTTTLRVEYALIPQAYTNAGNGISIGARALLSPMRHAQLRTMDTNVKLRASYRLSFHLWSAQGASGSQNVIPVIQQGLVRAFGDGGIDFFRNRLGDLAANVPRRAGKVSYDGMISRGGEEGEDDANPELFTDVHVVCDTVNPPV